jgi:hypothetical protein
MGEVAYALVGKGADRAIAQAADGLSKSLH